MQTATAEPSSKPTFGFRKLLVAADGSEPALRAVDVAAEVASRYWAELHVVVAAEPALPSDPEIALDVQAVEVAAERRLEAQERWIVDAAAAHGIGAEVHVLNDHSAHAVVDFARHQGIDLLFVSGSSHPNFLEALFSGIHDALLGSRTGQIIDRAPCSIMIVK